MNYAFSGIFHVEIQVKYHQILDKNNGLKDYYKNNGLKDYDPKKNDEILRNKEK